MDILDKINSPKNLKQLKVKQLPMLCQEIRSFILNTVSKVGGHLASNLGSVELTVALHYVFDSPKDKLCWDVGHQTYVHKILTGRKDKLANIRQFSGLSGFPKVSESNHDLYNTGHAGTSISQALGEAVARDQKLKTKKIKKKYSVVAVTGDASIVSGMSFEAMNHAGDIKSPFLVILNDNEMSISRNVGALSYTFNNLVSKTIYYQKKNRFYNFLRRKFRLSIFFEEMFFRFGRSVKSFIAENHFFDTLGFHYLGPIDGHDVVKLVNIMKNLKEIETPTVLHLVTKKGKGYQPAEVDPVGYHGVASFSAEKGIARKKAAAWNFSKFVGASLSELAKVVPEICVITPAMKEGSGLVSFANEHPDKFFDVGISEQHAGTFSGSLAKAGLKPFLCIYSTFLQRAYDQLIQDIALMNLPVRIIIDRAGCVGSDGETHQGLYDIAFMSCIPNVEILSAKDPIELMHMLSFMSGYEKHPISVRFPKKNFPSESFDKWLHQWKQNKGYPKNWSPFKAEVISKGEDAVIFTEGTMLDTTLRVKELLESQGIDLEVISLKSIRPLDQSTIAESIKNKKIVFTIENHVHKGGVGEMIQIKFRDLLVNKKFHSFAYPEEPVPHGSISDVEAHFKLDTASVASHIEKTCKQTIRQVKSILAS